jgi:AraC-like DNA-binding protein
MRSQALGAPIQLDHDAPDAATLDKRNGRNFDLHMRSVERVIRAMADRLDTPMSNAEMAQIACFSPCHFNRVFHKITGIPPIQFHYALRLVRAKHLLIETDQCITDICLEVGYNSLGTFITRFNELVGLSPNAFRRFARQIASMRVADLHPAIYAMCEPPRGPNAITGRVERGEPIEGLVFTALFPRSIPEGAPAACALTRALGPYGLSMPGDGEWFAFSVAVPWTATGVQLLTLDGLPHGRSGPIRVAAGHWAGDSTIVLKTPSVLDPPILAAIPLLVARLQQERRVPVDLLRRAVSLQPSLAV